MGRLLVLLTLATLLSTGCATLHKTETKSETKPAVAKAACEPRDRKPTSATAPFLVEAFRCSMQPGANLNVGIRVYSSIDGKETNLIYGPDRMDSPPMENDSILYSGVKVLPAGTSGGKTQYSFQHPKISLQISVPRGSLKTDILEAVYSDDTAASGVKGYCMRVSTVTY